MDDLKVEFTEIKDEANYLRGGALERVTRYTFYIGKHGPFNERVPVEQARDSSEINRRVELLKTKIRTLAT